MPKFGRFLVAIVSDWTSGVSGGLSVPFTLAAFFVPSPLYRILFAVLAVTAGLIASYSVWAKEHDKAEEEKAKNEVAPRMDIDVLNVVLHGALGAGVTDLFFSIRLILGQPSQVLIREFSLTIFDADDSVTIAATEDVSDWELVRKQPDDQRSHVQCVPIVKELTRRGDPVQGWIHFSLHGLTESSLQRRTLTLKVNCIYGTCYFNVQGAYARVDPDIKGVMRKRVLT